MSTTTQARSEAAAEAPSARALDMKLEVVVIPVSDVDRAKRFYDNLGWRLDADFVKIDTEGAEDAVWRGMEGLLRRNRSLTVFMEFTPARYSDAAAFLDTILDDGFALNRIDYFDPQVVVPTTREAVLTAPPHEDQMLVLIR